MRAKIKKIPNTASFRCSYMGAHVRNPTLFCATIYARCVILTHKVFWNSIELTSRRRTFSIPFRSLAWPLECQLSTKGQNADFVRQCGSSRTKNASFAVAPPPQRGHVTLSWTCTGRFIARAKITSHEDADVNVGTRRPSPTPPHFASRRTRRAPLHGAFRRHQSDGTPQPHARSLREKGAMWCVVSRDTACWWFSGLGWADDEAFGAGEGFVRERF
jgi:hypothetical protein